MSETAGSTSKTKTVAIVGATGAVGQALAGVLARRRFPAAEYRLLASARSAGKTVDWIGEPRMVAELSRASFEGVDIAFFSAGGDVSRLYAEAAVSVGTIVIDNSSAFRMMPDVPLVIPEINAEAARRHAGIIANPNCSTIIMAVPLWPLHCVNTIRRVIVSTYQAVSGAGARAMEELDGQTADVLAGRTAKPEVLSHQCAFNVFSHDTAIDDEGLNVEESKMIAETRKIFGTDRILIAPTCMRVPVRRAHLESLSVEFSDPIGAGDVREILLSAPGVRVVDDRAANHFPMPVEAEGLDEILVGRIRRDATVPENRGIQLICCGDQLLKGAALNAVQIAELLV
ncbi:MAG: aspartate-semialdehyde dehydrogenase [Planctomycetes bacterium]|nr:aspartate-semialdehyde dehydrogenase [Planctomycetota bacterium]